EPFPGERRLFGLWEILHEILQSRRGLLGLLELDQRERFLVERGGDLVRARVVHQDLPELLHRLAQGLGLLVRLHRVGVGPREAAAPGWRPAASSCAASSSTRALRVASVEDRPSMRCMSVAVWRSPSDCCSRTRRSSWAVRVSSSALARWAFCWAWARSARSWKTSCFVASPV